MAKKKKLDQASDEIDMTPMIDMIFLLIIFFILAGKITSDLRPEKITVPPTKTALKTDLPPGWSKVVINLFGTSQTSKVKGQPPRHTIAVGEATWRGNGYNDFGSYQKLRDFLDRVYNAADKIPDPNGTGLMLPMVEIELRADSEAEYRVVQEVQQVMTDTVNPYPSPEGKCMLPKMYKNMADAKPFVQIRFTSRRPDK